MRAPQRFSVIFGVAECKQFADNLWRTVGVKYGKQVRVLRERVLNRKSDDVRRGEKRVSKLEQVRNELVFKRGLA